MKVMKVIYKGSDGKIKVENAEKILWSSGLSLKIVFKDGRKERIEFCDFFSVVEWEEARV